MNRIRSSVPVPAHGRDLVRYAAAYIHPAVERVWIEDEAWWVESAELLPQTLVDEGFELLCRRFGSLALPPLVPRFTLAPPAVLPAPAAEIAPARLRPSRPQR